MLGRGLGSSGGKRRSREGPVCHRSAADAEDRTGGKSLSQRRRACGLLSVGRSAIQQRGEQLERPGSPKHCGSEGLPNEDPTEHVCHRQPGSPVSRSAVARATPACADEGARSSPNWSVQLLLRCAERQSMSLTPRLSETGSRDFRRVPGHYLPPRGIDSVVEQVARLGKLPTEHRLAEDRVERDDFVRLPGATAIARPACPSPGSPSRDTAPRRRGGLRRRGGERVADQAGHRGAAASWRRVSAMLIAPSGRTGEGQGPGRRCQRPI